MTDTVIRVRSLGKLYRIGSPRAHYRTVRDTISSAAAFPFRALGPRFRRLNGNRADEQSTIWALRNVSFDVSRGEVVGIIGRNGAGKSTLLKLLCRITEPTTGYAEISGRVGSLLEVGTGFHAELTGRENVFLSGAILGMRRGEIIRKLDEIVAFAEVDQFIDTPVKHYSSGMYLRLGFAVAAHLEPDILLVDEVLAVGDAAFQDKCLGKMEDVAHHGRTVLFVSHNMGAIQTLCRRALVVNGGIIRADGDAYDAVSAYLRGLETASATSLGDRTDRHGAGNIRLSRVEIFADDDPTMTTLASGRAARFAFHLTALRPGLRCSFTVYDPLGNPITSLTSSCRSEQDLIRRTDEPVLVCRIEELPLVPGRYRINVAIASSSQLEDHVEGAAFFDVRPGVLRGRPINRGTRYGSTCVVHRWELPAQ